jgi:hypothetical protein
MTVSIVQYARRYSLSSAPNRFCRFSRTHACRYTDENAFWRRPAEGAASRRSRRMARAQSNNDHVWPEPPVAYSR